MLSFDFSDCVVCFTDGDACTRIPIGVDLDPGPFGISLAKKRESNLTGQVSSSCIQLVESSIKESAISEITRKLNGKPFGQVFYFRVEDASPDTVVTCIAFRALIEQAEIPIDFWTKWVPVITNWEMTGLVENPDTSWPALASALAHSMFEPGDANNSELSGSIAAWHRVAAFALEAIRAEYDPGHIPVTAQGKYLEMARAALEREKVEYRRKVHAQEVHQIRLPMTGLNRTRLIDCMFTQEQEFTGAMKVLNRTDTETSPLGEGYGMLVLVRPELKDKKPESWLTISLDVRKKVHLADLWRNLEKREADAWVRAGLDRPAHNANSRVITSIVGVTKEEQHFHEQWWLTKDGSLIGSPKPVVVKTPDGTVKKVASLLSENDVRDAIFEVYDPFATLPFASSAAGAFDQTLHQISPTYRAGGRRIYQAWWSPEDPLPHPKSQVPYSGLNPTLIRAFGAKTMGKVGSALFVDAPALEDLSTVAVGNALAIVSDRGVFLLHSGRSGPNSMSDACELIKSQINIAHTLDDLGKELSEVSDVISAAIENQNYQSSDSDLIQRKCTRLSAKFSTISYHLKSDINSMRANLVDLDGEISNRWKTGARNIEYMEKVSMLSQADRNLKEIRLHHLYNWAAATGLAILGADALAGRVSKLATLFPKSWSQIPTVGVFLDDSKAFEFTSFLFTFVLLLLIFLFVFPSVLRRS